jgi:hypothetical protein
MIKNPTSPASRSPRFTVHRSKGEREKKRKEKKREKKKEGEKKEGEKKEGEKGGGGGRGSGEIFSFRSKALGDFFVMFALPPSLSPPSLLLHSLSLSSFIRRCVFPLADAESLGKLHIVLVANSINRCIDSRDMQRLMNYVVPGLLTRGACSGSWD